MNDQQHELTREALRHAEYWWQQMSLPTDESKMRRVPYNRYRAELRRCGSADAAMLTEGFRTLWLTLPESVRNLSPYSIEAWATVAAVLAHIKEAKNCSFGESLWLGDRAKEQITATDKAVVSELRLQQLQGARSSQDFFRRLHRLVKQLGGKADPKVLTQDILDWFDEHYSQQPRRADKRVAVRWALDYFSQQPKKA